MAAGRVAKEVASRSVQGFPLVDYNSAVFPHVHDPDTRAAETNLISTAVGMIGRLRSLSRENVYTFVVTLNFVEWPCKRVTTSFQMSYSFWIEISGRLKIFRGFGRGFVAC